MSPPNAAEQPGLYRIVSELESAKMELWPLWAVDTEASQFQGLVSSGDVWPRPQTMDERRYGDENRDDSGWCVLRPTSPKQLLWDSLSLLVLAVDITTLPLFFFGFDQHPMSQTVRMFSTIFWTLDIAVMFFKGYEDSGVVVLRVAEIRRNYVRTWLFFDVAMVSVDWMLFFFDTSVAAAVTIGRVGKFVRVVRVIRVLRLLRAMKVCFLVGEIGDFGFSEVKTAVLTIARLLFILLIVIHFVACGWYAVGTAASGTSKGSWLDELRFEELEDDMLYCYAAAFHWAMAQFTPAPINYHPHNRLERFYAIIVLFMGFTFFSAFLANVSGVMNRAMSNTRKQARQRELTRQFISDNKVSLALAHRVIAFVRHHRARASTILESDIEIFKALPDTLLFELRQQVYLPILATYTLFRSLELTHKGTMAEVCGNAMTSTKIMQGREVFHCGMETNMVYFIINGALEYVSGPNVPLSLLSSPTEQLKKGDWLCEPVLYMRWSVRGQCTAQECTDLAVLDSKRFRSVAARHPTALTDIRAYARRWFERVATKCAENGTEFQDLDDRLRIDLDWNSVVEQTPSSPRSDRSLRRLMSQVRFTR